MAKYLIKFTIFAITILTANLLGDYAGDFLTSFKNQYKPLTFTLIAMAVIVAIFYPLFEFLEKWIEKLSKRILREGKNSFGPKLGLFLFFFISITILTHFYAKLWYDINIFHHLFSGNFKGLF